MLEIEKYKSELQALKADIDLMGASIDPEAISDKVDELEHVAAEPGFWDDPERAQSILAKVKNLKSKLTTQQDMESRAEDLAVLIELSEAEDDQSVIDEIGQELASLREKFNEVKLSTLLTGNMTPTTPFLTSMQVPVVQRLWIGPECLFVCIPDGARDMDSGSRYWIGLTARTQVSKVHL